MPEEKFVDGVAQNAGSVSGNLDIDGLPNQGAGFVRKSFFKRNKFLLLFLSSVFVVLIFGYFYYACEDSDVVGGGDVGFLGSPFGVATGVFVFDELEDIGVSSIRYGGPFGIVWERIENSGWQENDDSLLKASDEGLEISVVVLAGNPAREGRLEEFEDFIFKAAERYDGDGVEDASGSPVVTYWEIDNEPDFHEVSERSPWMGEISETADYAKVLKVAYKSIKAANPDAKVAIAGMAYSVEYYSAIFDELEKIREAGDERYFDVFNYHYYVNHEEYFQVAIPNLFNDEGPSLETIKDLLEEYKYDVNIILTEVGTYRGDPVQGEVTLEKQTETEQAVNLFKKYIYPLADGSVERVYWFWDMLDSSESNMFVTMDLSGEGYNYLAYYTFKLMVDSLDGADWKNIEMIFEGEDGLYAYKFDVKDEDVWVVWWDNWDSSSDTKTVLLSSLGISGDIEVIEVVADADYGSDIEAIDYPDFFNSYLASDKVVLGELPLILGNVELGFGGIIQSGEVNNNFSGKPPKDECIDECVESGSLPLDCLQECKTLETPVRPSANKKCPDGICDEIEKMNPDLCPQDCG